MPKDSACPIKDGQVVCAQLIGPDKLISPFAMDWYIDTLSLPTAIVNINVGTITAKNIINNVSGEAMFSRWSKRESINFCTGVKSTASVAAQRMGSKKGIKMAKKATLAIIRIEKKNAL